MFPGSPHGFVIVKNLKRNCQDTDLTRAPKGIFYPVAWEAANPKVGSWLLNLYVCTHLSPLPFSRGESWKMASWSLNTRAPEFLLLMSLSLIPFPLSL